MTTFLLYKKGLTGNTGRKIARALNIQSGQTLHDKVDNLIRWGSSERIKLKPNNIINSREAILNSSNKLKASRIIREAGISIPDIMPLIPENIRNLPYPVLARSGNHQGGTDIELCLQVEDAERAIKKGLDYAIRYIPTRKEYRVHIFKNLSIKVSQKYPTKKIKEVSWIRNRKTGYVFKAPNENDPMPKNVREVAKKAVAALALDFGAVDIILSDGGVPYVLEVNTGPGLIASGVRKYATHLASNLELELNEEYLNGLEKEDTNANVSDPS